MRPSRRRLGATIRTSRFETFEPRLVMSISPIGTLEQPYGELQQFATASTEAASVSLTNSYGFTGSGQTVVVIDSGIAYSHSALGGGYGSGYRVVGGYDFAENDDNPYDDGPMGGHGSHVAGIIGSSDASHPGLASGVDLVSLRVFDDAGHGEFKWVEEALQWVHTHLNSFAHPITTVNLSIGSSWNSESLPAWATLEDEFAQLETDGIFISVAAGNSFTSYNTAGVSYPAASSHVVPVASVDADGQLSYYSQRDARVIAAPGRAITSTVPDYLGNGNGVDDDYATFSGTSMAAPYVAAASVLLRQAYQFVGISSVNEQMLYTLMRNTADTVYDSVTGQSYLRLNLQHALDAIVPADDFGSTTSTADALGTVRSSQSVSGTIGRADDRDYFAFTAGSSGTVSIALGSTDAWKPEWQLVGATGTASADGKSFTFSVVAGQTYTFAVGTTSGLGHYALKIDLSTNTSDTTHAPGGQQDLVHQAIDAGGKWFTFQAANSGILTVEAQFAKRLGDVDVELFDAQGNWLAGSYSSTNSERIDWNVTAGQTVYVHAYLNGSGTNSDVEVKLTNLLQKIGSTINVLGTDGDDVFCFTAGATDRLSINGVQYSFDSAGVTRVNFQGFLGSDSATVEGTSGKEVARLDPGTLVVQGTTYRVQATSVETITFRGGGGDDSATLGDSAGDDHFEGRPDLATLVGNGFALRVEGVARVAAESRKGGNDEADLYDSAGNDTFVASPGYSFLVGSSFAVVTRGFDAVRAESVAGGRDRAIFHDSAGNDRFSGDPSLARFWTGSYLNTAARFAAVTVWATAGGNDTATLSDSAGDDVFTGLPATATLVGSGYAYCLKGFDAVDATASTGHDVANLFDSAGDDTFASTPEEGRLSGSGFFLRAGGFDTVQAYATAGGRDRAVLCGSSAQDTLVSTPGSASIAGSDFFTRVRFFEEVETRAGGGSDDLALSAAALGVPGGHASRGLFDTVLSQVGQWYEGLPA